MAFYNQLGFRTKQHYQACRQNCYEWKFLSGLHGKEVFVKALAFTDSAVLICKLYGCGEDRNGNPLLTNHSLDPRGSTVGAHCSDIQALHTMIGGNCNHGSGKGIKFIAGSDIQYRM